MEFVCCNLCGSNESDLIYPSTINGSSNQDDYSAFRCTSTGYGKHHAIVKCRRCGLVFASPRTSGNEVLAKYTFVEDPLYAAEREGRVMTFGQHLRPMQRLLGPPDGRLLLDVGAHIGIFVDVACKAGWNATGLEPSRWSVQIARQSGIELIEGTLDSAGLPANHFDVVTMWDVIEHVPDPMAELNHVFRVLKPGGWVVIHTMNIESYFARLMGRRWPWLMEMHLSYFTPKTLRSMLERARFEWKMGQPQGRYLRLGYLVSRFQPFAPRFITAIRKWIEQIRIEHWTVAVNLGDLMTVYAQKPETGAED